MDKIKGQMEKHAGGRPTLYQDGYIEQAQKLCLIRCDRQKTGDVFWRY